MSERPPISYRELAALDVAVLKGVGEKKKASLAAFDVHTVLDLLMTYPRRWVDRTNEARIDDLIVDQEALVIVTVRSVTKRVLRNRRRVREVVAAAEG